MTAPELADRLAAVRSRIADAVREAGRDERELTTIVVTKFHGAWLVRELYGLGVRTFGESRHQEARQKSRELGDLAGLHWHFIGQLQSNKAAQATDYAEVVHSVDRPSLADALSAAARPVGCFLQLNLTEDPHRGGVREADLEPLAERVLGAPNLRLLGVMAVAPLDEQPRRAFARVRAASQRLLRIAPDAGFISAGMSGDYPEAILEGATHLRIGSAITGKRPDRG